MASVIGMTEKEAEGELAKQGYIVRVAKVDDNDLPLTAEFNLQRMNLIIKSNRVVRAYVG